MDEDQMDVDESPLSRKAKSLEALIGGPLSSSLSSLSSSSCVIPANKDFHFFYNFDEFKRPIQEISGNSQSLLETIGSSAQVWGKPMRFAGDIDGDDSFDWLVNLNDEIFERFDMSMDEFERIRKKEEEIGRPLEPVADAENGFQMVYGRKKKAASNSVTGSLSGLVGESSGGVKVAERDKKASGTGKAKVPFHIPTIKKPQEEYNILVNNANQPFEHVWLERSEDGQRFVHPLEKFSVLDFVDKDVRDAEPAKPPTMDETPFKLVEEVKDLKELAAKLRSVNEFAVDLEHNQYRSFQGLTCLMQISTRTEDFIVDTLKLRIHVGPYLREVFKDPKKKKVMHGADRDIIWLQRDFGIYICNLFDTGQASRVLKSERNSLEFLLHHFCGVTANKEYQNAEWRLRPLPNEMIRYAREDTHYLLYIYDVMKINLQSMPKEDGQPDSPLVEVYKRSYDLCVQLYEKDLLTEDSYLHIYGLQATGFNAVQLAIVAGLCEWRDAIARAEDESTGYVLPNKTLLEIAKEMPVTASKLRRLLKSRHPYIEKNIGSVVSVIRHSMQNAATFEAAALSLKEWRPGTVKGLNVETGNGSEAAPFETTGKVNSPKAATVIGNLNLKEGSQQQVHNSFAELSTVKQEHSVLSGSATVSIQSNKGSAMASGLFPSSKVSAAVQVSKKPTSGFGVLLGNAASKRKIGTEKKAKEDIKLEQIRSSVNLPFRSFLDKAVTQSKPVTETPSDPFKPTSTSNSDDLIVLEDDLDEETRKGDSRTSEDSKEGAETPSKASETHKREAPGSKPDDVILLEDNSDEEPENVGNLETENASKAEGENEPMSLSELSTNFKQCFKSMNENKKSGKPENGGFMSLKPGFLDIKPFDYAAAKKQVKFGEGKKAETGDGNKQKISDSSSGKKKGSSGGVDQGTKDGASEFSQGRRRQAFPASGNRNATFL